MIKEKSWKDFRDTGLLWFINSILHMFGWAIVFDSDNENAYPARVKFRGFSEEINTNGYIKVSEFLKENIDQLCEETKK